MECKRCCFFFYEISLCLFLCFIQFEQFCPIFTKVTHSSTKHFKITLLAAKRERKWSKILLIKRKKNKLIHWLLSIQSGSPFTKVNIQRMCEALKKRSVGKNNKHIMQCHLKFCFSSNFQPCHSLSWQKHKYFRFTNKCRSYIVLNRIITNIIKSYWAMTQYHYQPKYCQLRFLYMFFQNRSQFRLKNIDYSRAENYWQQSI